MLDDDDIPNAHDVFISYAHLDGEHDVANAAKIGEWLEREGFDVWWDRHLMSGDWQRQLVQKAGASRTVIVLWSPDAAASKHVHAECMIAAAKGTLFPLIIEDDPKHPLPKEWMHFQHLKLTDFEKQKPRILAMLPPPSRKKNLSPRRNRRRSRFDCGAADCERRADRARCRAGHAAKSMGIDRNGR